MSRSILASALAVAVAAGFAPLPSPAQAQPVVINPFFYSGHQFCWYDDAWRGPGW